MQKPVANCIKKSYKDIIRDLETFPKQKGGRKT